MHDENCNMHTHERTVLTQFAGYVAGGVLTTYMLTGFETDA